jgi:hypothetical protein
MSKIKLNLRNLSVPDKIGKGRQIIAAMTNNTSFANPHPPLPEIATSLTTLEETYKSHQAVKADIKTKASVQDDAERQVDRALTQLAAYVESIAGSDETIIASASMETKAFRSAPSVLTAPAALSASTGDHDGEIDLSWKKVDNARSYIIQFSADPPTSESWTHGEIATTSSKTVQNLTSGKKYWFRVAAVGSLGQSGWSEPATRIAP